MYLKIKRPGQFDRKNDGKRNKAVDQHHKKMGEGQEGEAGKPKGNLSNTCLFKYN